MVNQSPESYKTTKTLKEATCVCQSTMDYTTVNPVMGQKKEMGYL